MIPVAPTSAPPNFDRDCLERGKKWLDTHPEDKEPPGYWRPFNSQLREAFQNRCGWAAFEIQTDGQMDHFVAQKKLRGTPEQWRIYDWSNFRYSLPTLNQVKRTHEVLDPFEVRKGWFRLNLSTLCVTPTDLIPEPLRGLAEFTVELLCNHPLVVRVRLVTFETWRRFNTPLEQLDEYDPLLSAEIRDCLDNGRESWLRSLSPPVENSAPRGKQLRKKAE